MVTVDIGNEGGHDVASHLINIITICWCCMLCCKRRCRHGDSDTSHQPQALSSAGLVIYVYVLMSSVLLAEWRAVWHWRQGVTMNGQERRDTQSAVEYYDDDFCKRNIRCTRTFFYNMTFSFKMLTDNIP